MDLSHSSYSRPWFLHDEYWTSGDRRDNRQNHWFGTWGRMWQRGRFSCWCFYTLHDSGNNWAQFENLTKQCTRMRFNETLLHDSAKTQTRAIAKNTMLIPGNEYHFIVEVEFREKIWITFLCGCFFFFLKMDLIQLIKRILEISKFEFNFPVNSNLKFSTNFWNCVSGTQYDICIKRYGILLRILWSIWKLCRRMSIYLSAYANDLHCDTTPKNLGIQPFHRFWNARFESFLCPPNPDERIMISY